MSGSPSDPWTLAHLVAIDLEGTGPQDGDNEAILEIAVVPIIAGLPHLPTALNTLVNPGRPIGRRPWLSPDLTDTAMRTAPALADIAPALAARINGHYLVGHNVTVDWRLLHRRLPELRPAGLIDTLRLSRALTHGHRHSLGALMDRLKLAAAVNAAAPGSQPHRALWDTVAAALLLPALIKQRWERPPVLGELVANAGVPMDTRMAGDAPPLQQPGLF
ncbi:3'-5' exonuclease [Micromonospora sp. DT62]|uniref:3'-5' exonuclease n=1 Tax=Micromonospora sp. DT62 TaxID=3416521 RepID=UPI003CF6A180